MSSLPICQDCGAQLIPDAEGFWVPIFSQHQSARCCFPIRHSSDNTHHIAGGPPPIPLLIDEEPENERIPVMFIEYMKAVYTAMREHPSWRAGQAFFNVLHDMRPDLAEEVRGTANDPFYRDDRILGFLEWLAPVGWV